MTAKKIRSALLSSFTVEPLAIEIARVLAGDAIEPEWWIAPFGTYWRVMLDESSALYEFAPEIVFVVVATDDLFGSGAGADRDSASEGIDSFIQQLSTLSARLPTSTIVACTFAPTIYGQDSLTSYKDGTSQLEFTATANLALVNLARERKNIYVADLAAEVSKAGVSTTFDARYFYAAGMRLNSNGNHIAAELCARFVRASLGARKKCVVLDLDGTLWGGIVGEVGPVNVVLGLDGAGKAYQDFQRELKKIQGTGVLLAIASKNDPDVALQTIREHPSMVLREDDFVSMQINWNDKAQNIIDVAAELDIALDSLVFLDDSPYERERVRTALPDVLVPDLPEDAADYPEFLRRLTQFDTLTVTGEDTERTKLYSDEKRRREIRQTADTLDDFLQGLGLKVSVRSPTPHEVARFAQLTQRTNQFNLTTRRYSESDIRGLLDDSCKLLLIGSSEDRIGSDGVIGAAIIDLKSDDQLAEIDTFLMSCRVLGRGVELAFVAALLQRADALGLQTMNASFINSGRNSVANGFLEKCGFKPIGGDRFTRSTAAWDELVPHWITMELDQKVAVD